MAAVAVPVEPARRTRAGNEAQPYQKASDNDRHIGEDYMSHKFSRPQQRVAGSEQSDLTSLIAGVQATPQPRGPPVSTTTPNEQEEQSPAKVDLIPQIVSMQFDMQRLRSHFIFESQLDNSDAMRKIVIDWATTVIAPETGVPERSYLLCLVDWRTCASLADHPHSRTIEFWFQDPQPHSIFQKRPDKLATLPTLAVFNTRMANLNRQASQKGIVLPPPAGRSSLGVAQYYADIFDVMVEQAKDIAQNGLDRKETAKRAREKVRATLPVKKSKTTK